jgi:hypothetical protein
MCDCCKKIIVQTNTTTSVNTVDFASVEAIDILKDTSYAFEYTALEDGDYILQLELYIDLIPSEGSTYLTSQLTKNSIVESNINANHRVGPDEIPETTYTHNCKITGVVTGDDIGFRLAASGSNAYINNGSITVIKVA